MSAWLANMVVPALLNRASTWPNGAAASAIRLQSSSLATSPWASTPLAPSASTRRTVSAASAWLEA